MGRNKDNKAEKPWLVKKTWKVFSSGSFEDDPKLMVQLLDPTNLPADHPELVLEPEGDDTTVTKADTKADEAEVDDAGAKEDSNLDKPEKNDKPGKASKNDSKR